MRSTLSTTRPARLAAAVTAAVALTACGGGDDPTISTGGGEGATSGVGATPVPGIDAAFNDADVAFIQDMKPHHDGAIAMAELAATRSASAEVKALADKIVAAQDPEIQTMQKMALAWGVDLEAGGGSMPGMDMGGMDSGEDVAALEPLKGPEFDKEFLTRMVAHHTSAVDMANVELAGGENPQAKEMAQDIVTSQTAEIAEMKTLLAAL